MANGQQAVMPDWLVMAQAAAALFITLEPMIAALIAQITQAVQAGQAPAPAVTKQLAALTDLHTAATNAIGAVVPTP